jgi:L-ascorbate metabolism protein UlaG (beta-lactamase superfamily)
VSNKINKTVSGALMGLSENRGKAVPLFLAIALVIAITFALANCASFGRTPRGERLERIKKSPNYRGGVFQNMTPTQVSTSDSPPIIGLFAFLFRDTEELRPQSDLPAVKTDLNQLNLDEDILVWLGHSSLFLQTHGKRFLFDPVLVKAAPIASFNKAFGGTDIYKPGDMPDIDYLVITHDHWDHLDYDTVLDLKDRTEKIICGLGVGEHFEYWGFEKDRIIELDWNESFPLDGGFAIHCLPARHFSGRGLFSSDTTLWASYMLQTPSRSIYISGDSGYDTHFADIGRQFGKIDLAIVENGQYNRDWKDIHLMPEDLVKAAKDLGARRLFTVHNSKYSLSTHSWKEPLENISRADETESLNLITPMIGEPVYLNDDSQVFQKWWKDIE